MRKILSLIFLAILVSAFVSCHDRRGTGQVVLSTKNAEGEKESPYMEGNRNIMRRENEEMQMFIKRYGWQMQRTPTGLYVEVLDPGSGELFVEGDRVAMRYSTFLLSGEQIYNSDSNGVKVFVVNRSEEIDALHEAAQLLRPGAKARLVIPSHLGYGVAGDGDRISGLQPFMMEVDVLKEDEQLPQTIIPQSYTN